jgi:hypothetical protein
VSNKVAFVAGAWRSKCCPGIFFLFGESAQSETNVLKVWRFCIEDECSIGIDCFDSLQPLPSWRAVIAKCL